MGLDNGEVKAGLVRGRVWRVAGHLEAGDLHWDGFLRGGMCDGWGRMLVGESVSMVFKVLGLILLLRAL